MSVKARYVHTNLVAKDWRMLAEFYKQVFGCEPTPPEYDYHGPELDAGIGISGMRVRGMNLRLPGCGNGGPLLEIFSYDQPESRPPAVANRLGYGHIAFAVDDVKAARDAVCAAGGHQVGQIVTLRFAGGASVRWCFVTDPEDNIIELQSWSRSS
jgi:predicted enzyme related to lactoylglutathione lyase